MSSIARSPSAGRAFIAVAVLAAFLGTLALTVSPRLHERIHPDAKDAHHECAITLLAAGNCHHTSAASLVDASFPPIQFSELPALTSIWVPSPFLGGRIFEHAPPVLA